MKNILNLAMASVVTLSSFNNVFAITTIELLEKRAALAAEHAALTHALAVVEEAFSTRRKDLASSYSPDVFEWLGEDQIMALPEVDPASIGINSTSDYLSGVVTPESMGSANAVRGIDSCGRNFLALKLHVTLNDGSPVVLAEVLHQRYNDDNSRWNWVSAMAAMNDERREYSSLLYASGGMSKKQFVDVNHILAGKEIRPSTAATVPFWQRLDPLVRLAD